MTASEQPATSSEPGEPTRERGTTDLLTDGDDTMDPTEVTGPVAPLVHDNLTLAWTIEVYHPMHFIFDAVNPARVFHTLRKHDDGKAFVAWTKANIQKSTEEDPNVDRMQFVPKPYR